VHYLLEFSLQLGHIIYWIFPTYFHILCVGIFPYVFSHIICWDFSLHISTYYVLGFFPTYFHILFVRIFPLSLYISIYAYARTHVYLFILLLFSCIVRVRFACSLLFLFFLISSSTITQLALVFNKLNSRSYKHKNLHWGEWIQQLDLIGFCKIWSNLIRSHQNPIGLLLRTG